MSFRTRLSLFFVAIVIVPMVSLALVLVRLVADNEQGKADARVAAAQEVAVNVFRDDRASALAFSERVGKDVRLAPALRAGDLPAARARAQSLLTDVGLVRIRIDGPGAQDVDVGRRDAIAPAGRPLMDTGGAPFGV